MSLPSGYKRLEYIRATGTQYLDLGVTMEKTDSVTLEATLTLDAPSDTRYFGANGYMQIAVTSGGYSISGSAQKSLGKQDVVKCVFASVAESLYINNVLAESKSWSSYNASNTKIGLFKMGDPSNGWYSGAALSGNLYGGTLVKNGVTVCSLIPCKNASGVAGVWDDAAGVFRGSAGTSNFVAGPETAGHHALIDGTGRDITGGKCLVGGTAYDIKSGRTLIGGTGYDIPFKTEEQPTTQTWYLNDYALGGAISAQISFTSNGTRFSGIKAVQYDYLRIDYLREGTTAVYVYDGSWGQQGYRTLVFDEAPTGDLLTWLQTNGTQI